MIKTCRVINTNHYYYSDTGGITGGFTDNFLYQLVLGLALARLISEFKIQNIKLAPIISPPPTPSTSHLETQRGIEPGS